MNIDEKMKKMRRENLNEILLSFKFKLNSLHACGLNDLESGILQNIFPHVIQIENDLNKLFAGTELDLAGQAIKDHTHRGVRR